MHVAVHVPLNVADGTYKTNSTYLLYDVTHFMLYNCIVVYILTKIHQHIINVNTYGEVNKAKLVEFTSVAIGTDECSTDREHGGQTLFCRC